MKRRPTIAQLRLWYSEAMHQIQLDTMNLHNKLGEPERQPNETITQYEARLRDAQFKRGYSEDDYVFL